MIHNGEPKWNASQFRWADLPFWMISSTIATVTTTHSASPERNGFRRDDLSARATVSPGSGRAAGSWVPAGSAGPALLLGLYRPDSGIVAASRTGQGVDTRWPSQVSAVAGALPSAVRITL